MFDKRKFSLFFVVIFVFAFIFVNCEAVSVSAQDKLIEVKGSNSEKSLKPNNKTDKNNAIKNEIPPKDNLNLKCIKPNKTNNKKLTVMVYCDADNDLEENLLQDIEKMKKGYVDSPSLNIVVLMDRSSQYSDDAKVFGENFSGSRLYKIEKHSTKRIGGGKEFPELTTKSNCEVNMGDATTLKKFINFCKANYTADKYVLIMSDHGGGARDNKALEDTIKYKAICEDESHHQGNDNDCLYTAEISEVLTKDQSVDLLVFDACFMGTEEVAYQYRPGNGSFEAKGMVASPPKVAVSGLNYEKIFNRLRTGGGKNFDPSTVTNEQLGSLFVEEQKNYMQDIGLINQELSYFDLSKAEAVKISVDDLAKALWKENKKVDLEKVRGTDTEITSVVHYFNETLNGEWVRTPYFDLYDLCKKINSNPNFGNNIQLLASNVMKNVDDMILYSYAGRKYEGFVEGKNGLSIFLPNGDKTYRDVETWTEGPQWQFQKWYNSIDTTTLDPNLYYGKLKWCKDGQDSQINKVGNWFELLDCWYDKSNDEKGGFNGYQW